MKRGELVEEDPQNESNQQFILELLNRSGSLEHRNYIDGKYVCMNYIKSFYKKFQLFSWI